MAILTRHPWTPKHCVVILSRLAQASGHNVAILTRHVWAPEDCEVILTRLAQIPRALCDHFNPPCLGPRALRGHFDPPSPGPRTLWHFHPPCLGPRALCSHFSQNLILELLGPPPWVPPTNSQKEPFSHVRCIHETRSPGALPESDFGAPGESSWGPPPYKWPKGLFSHIPYILKTWLPGALPEPDFGASGASS